MRFGLLQIGIGLLLFSLAALGGGVFWGLAWPAAAVTIVGIAYLVDAHGVFGKSTDTGALGLLPSVTLAPYRAVAWCLWQLKSRLQSEDAYNEVAPGILVGRRPLHAGEAPPGLGVTVDLTSEFERSEWVGGRYVAVPTLDTRAPSDLAALVDRLGGESGPILFHCAMGHGRSATAAAAVMLSRGLVKTVDEAERRMQASRPKIRLHGTQRAAVRRLNDDPTHDPRDRPPHTA